jgi:hypothetical protein
MAGTDSHSAETPAYNLDVSPIIMPASYSSARHLRLDSSRNARTASQGLNNEARQNLRQRALDMNRWVGLASQSRHAGPGQVKNFFSSSYRVCSEQDTDESGICQNIFNEQIKVLREELRYLHASAWIYSNNKNG